jgi:RNA polymerase sigma factor (sigma-70 family)
MPPLSEIKQEDIETIKRLSKHFALKNCMQFDFMLDDVIAEIQEKLYRAYTLHDPDKGSSLLSYLYQRAYGASIDVRRKLVQQYKGIKRSQYNEENFKFLGFTVYSLDLLMEDTDERSGLELKADNLPNIDFNIDFENFLDTLTDRQRYVALMRIEGYTGTEIAKQINVTESRISQLCERIYDLYLQYNSEQRFSQHKDTLIKK